MGARFELNPEGIREYLRSDPVLAAALYEKGQNVVEYAKSIAPVGDPKRNRNRKEHPGTYRDSIQGEFHMSPTRMTYRILSRDPKAYWIEYGSKNNPKMAVLRRALDHAFGFGGASGTAYAGIEHYMLANPQAAKRRAERRRRVAEQKPK